MLSLSLMMWGIGSGGLIASVLLAALITNTDAASQLQRNLVRLGASVIVSMFWALGMFNSIRRARRQPIRWLSDIVAPGVLGLGATVGLVISAFH